MPEDVMAGGGTIPADAFVEEPQVGEGALLVERCVESGVEGEKEVRRCGQEVRG